MHTYTPSGQVPERFCFSAILPTWSITHLQWDQPIPWLYLFLPAILFINCEAATGSSLHSSETQAQHADLPDDGPSEGQDQTSFKGLGCSPPNGLSGLPTSLLSSSSMCSSCNGFLSLLPSRFFHKLFLCMEYFPSPSFTISEPIIIWWCIFSG